MKRYGIKRNWNHIEDFARNAEARSARKQRRLTKIVHRRARRIAKYALKKGNV